MQRDLKELGTELAGVCVRAAELGAGYIRSRGEDNSAIEWQLKARADFVTEVDRTAEERIATALLERYPGATVVGEELSPAAAADSPGGITFVVDPLDGTTNFMHGYPQYAVSVAALVDGIIAAGAIVDVPRRATYRAAVGSGAWHNDAPLRVSGITDPSRSLVGTGFPFKHGDRMEAYLSQLGGVLRSSAGVRRAGAAALDLADVAAGRLDAFWELMLAPWDIAAGVLLVREAGGRVTDLRGNDVVAIHTPVVASNGALHPWLLGHVGERHDSAAATSLQTP